MCDYVQDLKNLNETNFYRLWSQTELKPVLNFFSTTKVVHDICWSPYADTVFCAVNEGAVEIWDLNINT